MAHKITVTRIYEWWPLRWRWRIDGAPWYDSKRSGDTFTAWGAQMKAERRVRELDAPEQRYEWMTK